MSGLFLCANNLIEIGIKSLRVFLLPRFYLTDFRIGARLFNMTASLNIAALLIISVKAEIILA